MAKKTIVAEKIEFGAQQFEEARKEMTSVLDLLFKRYDQEGVHVAYTLKQFHQDYVMDVVPELLEDENLQTGFFSSLTKKFSVDKVLSLFLQDKQWLYQFADKIFSMSLDDEHLKNLSVRKFFSRLSPSERMEGLSANERVVGLSVNERMEGLSPDEIQAYLQQLEDD